MTLCPPAGTGVHSWILAAANCLAAAGVSAAEAERIIHGSMSRPPSPANEIQTAVEKAYRERGTCSAPRRYSFALPHQRPLAPRPLTAIQFDPAKLARVASRIKLPPNWRHWLWERSPKRPESMNGFSFLANLYPPGERVLVFDKMRAKKPLGCVTITEPMDCRVPDVIRAGGRYGAGIWFLSNPVDGQWHPNPRQNKEPSCRSEESVTSFRYVVLESDQAPPDLWLAFIAQVPVRVSAIYTSGSRSIHALARLDAGSKAEWDEAIAPLKRPLKAIGADPGALSAVRLTRLPGCWRPEKQGFQQLLYLAPDAPDLPLMDVPVRFTRAESLKRWKSICPRWNLHMEAEQ